MNNGGDRALEIQDALAAGLGTAADLREGVGLWNASCHAMVAFYRGQLGRNGRSASPTDITRAACQDGERVRRADVLSGTCIRLDHRSERQIARMIQRLLKNAMR
jgi:hypothetical protein